MVYDLVKLLGSQTAGEDAGACIAAQLLPTRCSLSLDPPRK